MTRETQRSLPSLPLWMLAAALLTTSCTTTPEAGVGGTSSGSTDDDGSSSTGGGGETTGGSVGLTSSTSVGGEASSSGSSGDGEDTSSSESGGVSLCGNRVVDPGELCDDGNDRADDGCSPDCTAPSGTLLWAAESDGRFFNLPEWYAGVAVDTEGSVYVAGAQWDPEQPPMTSTRGWLGKFSANGELAWETHLGQDWRFGPIAVAPDGNVVVAGDMGTFLGDRGSWLGAFSPDGELLWSQEQHEGYVSPFGLDIDADGNLLICGATQVSASTRLLTAEGEELWNVPLSVNSVPWTNSAMDCAFGADGDVLVAFVDTVSNLQLRQLTALGVPVWSHVGTQRPEGLVVAPDGTSAIAGGANDVWAGGFGADGGPSWSTVYENPPLFESAHDLVRHGDGTYTIVGDVSNSRGFIAHLSETGDEVWSETFGEGDDALHDPFVAIADDAENGVFYVVEHRATTVNSASGSLWLRKYVP